MRNSAIPKTIQKWIDKNKDIICDYHMEDDGFMVNHNYSIWVYFKAGTIFDNDVHMIHEATVKDFIEATKNLSKCSCERCVEAIANWCEL